MAKNTNLAGQPVICQLLSFLPRQIVDFCVSEHLSDRYYKTMTTWKQLVFMLYGVVTKCHSLNSLCKNLLFLEDRLTYLGIDKLPAVSTLSDANINRNSTVFESIYQQLLEHYKEELSPVECSFLAGQVDTGKVIIVGSSTISLFVDVFKGAGRNPMTGKKKGGLKIHAKMPLGGFVPALIHITEAACNDKSFLGQLEAEKGAIYVFDKGYVNYQKWKEWTEKGAYFVTRLNDNADYLVLEGQPNHISEYADGGVVSDQIIMLNPTKDPLKARLIIYKDPVSGKVLEFVSNMFDYSDSTVILLYKYRWNIEILFKQLKQNFELGYFYSDSMEGIKTQVWIALIANLLFSVIHRQCREAEQFVTIVNMAAINMCSYISLIKLVRSGRLSSLDRDLKIVQFELFSLNKGGLFQNSKNSP
ncbi:FOG: Transposase and inactivated derivatives [Aquiflexum balticum DSM 16537]|uniref:FOG: Transposase and inactivated derivatives n=1 Tax=Aquiflexum balticum DSM 16537 TaxID=758820 RepID=A0A1W2HBX0_9BACT|nr:IS4 family transposase [Aquiflexum balticum]SMD46301.1 FOG: Transposase and inactivated derivatives [Aquiflexum balticum DSM 16537]